MRHLPLYVEPPKAAVEVSDLRAVDHACRRCALPELTRPKTVCINAEGEAGGLLVVGEAPGRTEDAIGRPFIGKSGKLLRDTIARHWKGSVAYDNAVRCFPGRDGPDDKIADACRGYLAQTIVEVAPTRIVCVGGWSAYSVLGRTVAPFSTRRGYAFLAQPVAPVPVFLVIHPAAALRNRFVRQWFEEDMAWALTTTVPTPPWDGVVHVVENATDARMAVNYLRSFPWSSFDVETAGLMYDPSFRIVCISFCPQGEHDAFLWGAEAFGDPVAVEIMLEYLRDVHARKRGQNVKYDENASDFEWDIAVQGLDGDTRLWRKLLDPEAAADLARMVELVGMGGMKEEKDRYSAEAVKKVRGIMAAEVRYAKAVAEYPLKLANSKTRRAPPQPVPPPLLSTLGVDAALEPIVRERAHGGAKKGWAHESDSWVYAVLDHTERDVVYRYNARDAVGTAALCDTFEPQLAAMPPLQRVWDRIVSGASTAVAQVERWGIPTDRGAILMFDQHLEGKEADAKQHLDSYFPGVNWNSAPQLRKILFVDLKLPHVKFTDAENESTDHDVLEELEDKHPLIPALLEFRRYTKLRSTYARGMLPHVRPDGRIHPSILLDGARSGRTSCVRRGTLIEVVRDVGAQPKGVPIENVREGDLAYCYLPTGALALRPVLRAWRTGHRELVRVRWRGAGNHHAGHVDVTPEHLVRLVTGEWRAAGALMPGDSVTALSRGTGQGYARLWPTGAPEITREHRFIYEQVHGTSPEHVHHDNERKLDNRVGNLIGQTASEHLSHHGRNCSDELRAKRSANAKASGRVPSAGVGSAHAGWLGLTRGQVEDALRAQDWSVTKAARAGGWDFDTFKKYAVLVGFDLDDLKRMNRAVRRDAIVAGAAHARAVRSANNHTVLRVEVLIEHDDVYDLTIAEAECFIAGELCVHNCKHPNLQNIPRVDDPTSPTYKGPEGRMARDCFCAQPGYLFVQADYSQLELRIAAMLSDDPVMKEIFRSGVDFHLRTAQMIAPLLWHILAEQVGKDHRAQAKAVNFGVLYGMTARTLAAKLGCSVAEAQRVMDAILGKFKRLAAWCKERLSESRRTGESWTIWDGERARRRSLHRIADEDDGQRITAENGAVNTPVQGTASDYCVRAIVDVVDWLREDAVPAELCLPVHDSLLLHVREDAVPEVAYQVRRIMESYPSDDVQLKVDIEVGPAWGSLSKYKEVA